MVVHHCTTQTVCRRSSTSGIRMNSMCLSFEDTYVNLLEGDDEVEGGVVCHVGGVVGKCVGVGGDVMRSYVCLSNGSEHEITE